MERRLVAILSADVQGYSRLMGDDEEATIRTLAAYREVMTQLIEQHRGRVVDAPGDNLLAEFASAVDAVQGAVIIQRTLQSKNAALPPHRQMHYRIGINIGDVVIDGERIYGDGVNIAARVERLAEGGGICISEAVHTQVENKLPLTYHDQGEQQVKNITKPVRVYRLGLEESSTLVTASHERDAGREVEASGLGIQPPPFLVHRARSRWGVWGAKQPWPWRVGAVGTLLLLIGITATVWDVIHPARPPRPSVLTSHEAKPPLSLPNKPSIAVLPFTNMSDDPEQEYFSDGMTEDLIIDLSKISGLFVIARNSVFTYKGKAVNVEQVGRDLGVRYVVEGSARKDGEWVRITAQLIDATNGGHLWAERYDRALTDLFTVQDEVVQRISAALRVEVLEAEQARVRRIPTKNLTAYDAWLRGVEYWWRWTPEANDQARRLFQRAVTLDPLYANAYAWLGWTYWLAWNWKVDPQLFVWAEEYAQHALTLDEASPDAYMLLGQVYLWHKKQPEQALAAARRAISLDPNNAFAQAMLADIRSNTGQPQEAIGLLQQAMRLNPRYHSYYPLQLGWAHLLLGQYDAAFTALQETVRLNPNGPNAYTRLAISYVWQWCAQRSHDPQILDRAVAAAQQGVIFGDTADWTHVELSEAYLWQKQYDDALAEAERAITLNPTEAQNHANLGRVLNSLGRPTETLDHMDQLSCETAMFSPYSCFSILGTAYYLTGQREAAITAFRTALTHLPVWNLGLEAHLGLAASYSEQNRVEEARAEIAEVLKINPQFSLMGVRQRWPYKDPLTLQRFVAALHRAALP
ncbi:MAG: tetratricopeptide repeat protein [Candidatus Binatia bacterium]